jgi:hypothetical protein
MHLSQSSQLTRSGHDIDAETPPGGVDPHGQALRLTALHVWTGEFELHDKSTIGLSARPLHQSPIVVEVIEESEQGSKRPALSGSASGIYRDHG